MTNRSADATLKGYFYQFDKTIQQIFSLPNDNDTVTIEGIEDIDIDRLTGFESIQCKYYSSKKLTNSSIREALILMLKHHCENSPGNSRKYTLYGYFLEPPSETEINIDLARLKAILTYNKNNVEHKYHEENSIDDVTLESFITLFQIIAGADFDEHRRNTIQLISKHFRCNEDEVEYFYYNNAVKIVFDIAIEANPDKRKIKKKEFIKRINNKEILFFSWFKLFKNKDQYTKLLSKKINEVNLLSPTKERILYIGEGVQIDSTDLPICEFVAMLIEKTFQLNRAKYTHKPLTLILDISQTRYRKLKEDLIKQGRFFNDGYEDIHFSAERFSQNPVINRNPNGTISKTSFYVKILSKTTFENNVANLNEGAAVLNIGSKNFEFPNYRYGQLVEGIYLDDLKDIIRIF